jgi:hypothetical protein
MTTRLQRHRALREALVLIVLLVAALATMVWVSQPPAGADELQISVSTLRSQAAELEQLFADSADSSVNPRFVRSHALQLSQAVDASREELEGMTVQPPLKPLQDEARPLAAQLASAVHAVQKPETLRSASSAAAGQRRVANHLDAIETALKNR